MTTKERITEALKHKTTTDSLSLLYEIIDELKGKNNKRINRVYNGSKVDEERPDLIDMK